MWLLCLETSTYEASVALAEDGVVAAEERFPGYTDLNRQFALRIKGLLERFSLRPADLGAVAVSQGPGFFTSLRVGVAAAKALAHALSIGLVAVSTLWLYALSWEKRKRTALLTAHPANARESFLALFLPGSEGPEEKEEDERTALLSSLSGARLAFGPVQAEEPPPDLPLPEGTEVAVCGPFSEKVVRALEGRGVGASVLRELQRPPISALARLAHKLIEAGFQDNPATLRPLYFSPSQAERTYGVMVT